MLCPSRQLFLSFLPIQVIMNDTLFRVWVFLRDPPAYIKTPFISLMTVFANGYCWNYFIAFISSGRVIFSISFFWNIDLIQRVILSLTVFRQFFILGMGVIWISFQLYILGKERSVTMPVIMIIKTKEKWLIHNKNYCKSN